MLENEEFLRRGGILAGPGLRGGDEYGPSWHQDAMKEKKIHTYDDLKAAAEEVVAEGWTTPAKIISTGASNGGLTAAATALLYPQDFGLVIPISGVDDFLGKERMDAVGQGWDQEYGSSEDPQMLPFMTAVSPLENAGNLRSLHFLILDGLNDTRLNHAHSLKLQAALEEQGGSSGWSELASFQHAGHYLDQFYYQNTIAWHVNALVWTAIFKQAGWNW
jgi:prolyl oligopeptidase